MLLTSLVTAAATAPHAQEIPPIAVGGGALVLLLILLVGLLMFGKGREHS
jgi:hypothetical protein